MRVCWPYAPARLPLVAVLLLVACARFTDVRVPPGQAPLLREHPLAGRIWDVRHARFVDADAVVAGLATSRYVLLGEKHDNPDHHHIQAALLRALLGTGRRPAVAFEMFTSDQAAALARQLAALPRDAAAIGEAVHWNDSGWPDWDYYRPIAQAALDAGVPIVAGNLPLTTVRGIARGEAEALPADLRTRYGLDHPLAPVLHARLTDEIRESHCGTLPDNRLDGMVLAQRARDAKLADSLLAADRDGGVLIAGLGHVREDWGVPTYLRARAPGARVATVAPLEVQRDWTQPADYAAEFDGVLPYDWIWFTPRMDEDDPCAQFKRDKP
ncbi:MAG TPA: ChaN family lipoprotein [Methylomirabilota bacterium]|nr:ChaN family lipoprotein [Methylomirabilota bacterium]